METFLYLLCFFFSFHSSFCYDYNIISDRDAYETAIDPHTYRRGFREDRESDGMSRARRKGFRKQKGAADQVIDVANFIQQPKEEPVNVDYLNFDSSKASKDYGDYEVRKQIRNGRNSKQKTHHGLEYMNSETDEATYNGVPSVKDRRFNTDKATEGDSHEHAEHVEGGPKAKANEDAMAKGLSSVTNSRSMKKLQFPFFFRKKTTATSGVTAKSERSKKCKMFCFNRKEKGEVTENIVKNTDTEKTIQNSKINSNDDIRKYIVKRSYEDLLCPSCKRRVEESLREEENIHNSRQYQQLQNTKQEAIEYETDDAPKRNEGKLSNRYKRFDEEERERQMKELEKLENRVNSVKIQPFPSDRNGENL